MQPRLPRAGDYRQQAARLRQQAIKITDSRKRIELLDMASHYETLAATAEPLAWIIHWARLGCVRTRA